MDGPPPPRQIWAGDRLHTAVTKHAHTQIQATQQKPDKTLNVRSLGLNLNHNITTIGQFTNTNVQANIFYFHFIFI